MTPLAGIRLVAPSTVAVGEVFSVHIKMLTAPYVTPWTCYRGLPRVAGPFNRSPRGIRYMDNVPGDWTGMVRIDAPHCTGPDGFHFDGRQGAFPGDPRPIAAVSGFSFDTAGTWTISACEPQSGVCGVSNPVRVTAGKPARRLVWGDPHSQTIFSDGVRCPEELCAFARDEGALDFFAVSDHAEWVSDAQWRYFTDVANAWNEPGRFATLIGLEWTSGEFGHRNVYYPGAAGPILRSAGPGAVDLAGLYRVARAEGALVVPHHSANRQMGVVWARGHDPEVERLCEVYSIWGNSERPAAAGNSRPIRAHGGECPGQHVLDALRMGRHYGLVGGGDIHDGRPGDELHTHQPDMPMYADLWPQGITGAWVRELTREALFEALWQRRVYAATNARIVLEFTVNGAPMGARVRGNGPRLLRVSAAHSVPIARVEVLRDGADWRRETPGKTCVDLEITDAEPCSRETWYSVRITGADGAVAWSSPVWVDAT